MVLTLPQFLANNKIGEMPTLLSDLTIRKTIETQIRLSMKHGQIQLETNHLVNNMTFEWHEMIGLSSLPSRRQTVYYTPQLGEILATTHQWGKRQLLLKHPLLPCLKIKGGLIRKWKRIGVSRPHVFFYPLELINVVERSNGTFANHAFRWGSRDTAVQKVKPTNSTLLQTERKRETDLPGVEIVSSDEESLKLVPAPRKTAPVILSRAREYAGTKWDLTGTKWYLGEGKESIGASTLETVSDESCPATPMNNTVAAANIIAESNTPIAIPEDTNWGQSGGWSDVEVEAPVKEIVTFLIISGI